MLSPKEKTVANAIRAFGYIFEKIDIVKFETDVLPIINGDKAIIDKIKAKAFNDPIYNPMVDGAK